MIKLSTNLQQVVSCPARSNLGLKLYLTNLDNVNPTDIHIAIAFMDDGAHIMGDDGRMQLYGLVYDTSKYANLSYNLMTLIPLAPLQCIELEVPVVAPLTNCNMVIVALDGKKVVCASLIIALVEPGSSTPISYCSPSVLVSEATNAASSILKSDWASTTIKKILDDDKALAIGMLNSITANQKVVDGVYYDSVVGLPGINDTNGTPQNPSNNLADVRTMLAARKLRRIYLSYLVTLDAAMVDGTGEGYEWIGTGHVDAHNVITLNNKSVNMSKFRNIELAGIPVITDFIDAEDCNLHMSAPGCFVMAKRCTLVGSSYLAMGSELTDCRAVVNAEVHIPDTGVGTKSVWNNWNGDITIQDMGLNYELHIDGRGVISLAGTCTGGVLYVSQNIEVINNSAGLAVTVIRTGALPELDAVYFNSVVGSAGATDADGLPQKPSNSLPNVRTMLAARKLSKIRMPVTKTGIYNVATLDAAMNDYMFEGDSSLKCVVDPNGKNIDGCTFKNVAIFGVPAVLCFVKLYDCVGVYFQTNAITIDAFRCTFGDTFKTTIAQYTSSFTDCSAATNSNPMFGAPVGTILNFKNWSGPMVLMDMAEAGGGHAASEVRIIGKGVVTLDASCTGGDLYVPQDMEVIRNDGGLVTIHREGALPTLDAVYFNSVTGSAGATDADGLPQKPSNDLASVLTMLAARKLGKIYFHFPVTLDRNMVDGVGCGFEWIGIGRYIDNIFDLGGFSAANSHLSNVELMGTPVVTDSIQVDDSYIQINAPGCRVYASRTIIGNSYLKTGSYLKDCSVFSSTGGDTTIYIVADGPSEMHFENLHGNLTFVLMTATTIIYITGKGVITLDATCTGGDLYYGDGITIIDNSGGAVTQHSTNPNTVEVINYAPGKVDSGDLVLTDTQATGDLSGGAYNVAAHAQPAAADFSAILTMATAYSGIEDIIRAITGIIIGAFNGAATHLYCDIYVDDPTGIVAANKLRSLDLTALGLDVDTMDVTNALFPTIYPLLNDGMAHTFYFFLWNDGTVLLDTVDISLLTLTERRLLNIDVNAMPATAQISKVVTSMGLPTGSGAKYYVQDLFGARFNVNIESLNAGAVHVYCQVSIDDPTGLVAANVLFNTDNILAPSDNVSVKNIDRATYPTIFPVLNDGGAHTLYFFLWTDAGDADVILLENWWSTAIAGNALGGPWGPWYQPFHLDYSGKAQGYVNYLSVEVSGSSILFLPLPLDPILSNSSGGCVNIGFVGPLYTTPQLVLVSNPVIIEYANSITDLNYYINLSFILVGGAH